MAKNIFKGRIVDLYLETVTLPNGATVEMEVIHHPGAAAIVPMKDEKTVLLIRQYRHAVGGYIYEIPAGKLDPGEDPKDCAARELEEEIGFRASALEHVVTFFTTPGFTDEVIHIFKATGLTPGTQNLESDEVLDVVEIPLEKAISQIADGTIRDGKTIVGLQAVYIREKQPAQRQVQASAFVSATSKPILRALTPADRDAALTVINTAARWYREFLPAEEFHDPEMTPAQWDAEAVRMTWYGALLQGTLVGVMGLEYAGDAALLRHAYILAEYQHQGIGTYLREHVEGQIRGVRRIIVGTYARNYKARGSLEKAGYTLSSDPETVLRTYYSIPDDRLKSSVTYEKSI